MADRKDILEILALISVAFPNFKMVQSGDVSTADAYMSFLGDIPSAELKMATLKCCSETGRVFAPSVGELRGAVLDLRRASMNIPSPYDAWQEVLRGMVERIGYDAPEWSSPLIEKVVRSLGWRNLCMSENQVADRARFIQAYEQFTERAEKERMLIPEVRKYLEDNGAKLLEEPNNIIKQLAKGLSK